MIHIYIYVYTHVHEYECTWGADMCMHSTREACKNPYAFVLIMNGFAQVLRTQHSLQWGPGGYDMVAMGHLGMDV